MFFLREIYLVIFTFPVFISRRRNIFIRVERGKSFLLSDIFVKVGILFNITLPLSDENYF